MSPLDIVHVGTHVSDVRVERSPLPAAFHVLHWAPGRRSLTNAAAGDVAMAVRGWLGDTPVVETRPTSGDWATTALNLLTDSGLREIGRIDAGVEDLTLATDLMTGSRPTADVPAPDWVPRDRSSWPWVGLGAGLVVAVTAGVLVLRRRRASR